MYTGHLFTGYLSFFYKRGVRIFLWQTKFEADKKCMLRKMDKGAVILLVVSATAVSVAGYARADAEIFN